MSNQRNFKPRKLIPKKQLLSLLEEGYTLDDIGDDCANTPIILSLYARFAILYA